MTTGVVQPILLSHRRIPVAREVSPHRLLRRPTSLCRQTASSAASLKRSITIRGCWFRAHLARARATPSQISCAICSLRASEYSSPPRPGARFKFSRTSFPKRFSPCASACSAKGETRSLSSTQRCRESRISTLHTRPAPTMIGLQRSIGSLTKLDEISPRSTLRSVVSAKTRRARIHCSMESTRGRPQGSPLESPMSGPGVIGLSCQQRQEATRLRIEAGMERAAPGLVAQVEGSLDDPIWEDRLSAWEEAWCWAVTNAWLERRSDLDYQQKLWRKRHDAEASIGQLIAEAASLRAWRHFFDRLSAREANALRSWREAVRAMGKGTGKSARLARLRGEARRYMDACRDAIPIWIMPRYLVAEMVDPVPDRYDLVIVDEASQLGIESLFLFYIAKKIIVVGDDQQI